MALLQHSIPGKNRRTAVLHDFCMIIPYSLAIILGSLLSIPLGTGWKGFWLAGGGSLELLLSIGSLQKWKQEKSHLPLTAASAG